MTPLLANWIVILYGSHVAYPFLLICTTGSVHLLALRTSQLQISCIGMVTSLGSLTGRRGVDLLPSPWYGNNTPHTSAQVTSTV
jgi:hypothetical protein